MNHFCVVWMKFDIQRKYNTHVSDGHGSTMRLTIAIKHETNKISNIETKPQSHQNNEHLRDDSNRMKVN